MNFRVQSIKRGYCEIWANTRTGQRYQRLAAVQRDEKKDGGDGKWRWAARHDEPPFFMPWFTYAFDTRKECVENCEKWALKRMVDRAIAQQTEESPHWHSPRRDAWCNVTAFIWLFTSEELSDIKRRLMTFEEGA